MHMRDRESANRKARDLLRMAVAKARLLGPVAPLTFEPKRSCLIVGGGVAGMVSALSVAEMGFEVNLVEKAGELGGTARRILNTLNGQDVQAYLDALTGTVREHPLIRVHLDAEVIESRGYVGDFTSKIAVRGDGKITEVGHGATIIATGAVEAKPQEYLYGQDSRVLTLLELERDVAAGNTRVCGVQTAVMIQCVGSRDDERRLCSRVCCSQSLRSALKLRELNPQMDIYVLYRDMMSYGLMEDRYREAAEKGVKFIRYELADKPRVTAVEEEGRSVLRVMVRESALDRLHMIDADVVALAVGVVAGQDNREVSRLFKVPLDEDGFFLEAHMKLRPVDFATDGIFLCGTAHYPKHLSDTIAQAQAAAGKAAAILCKKKIETGVEVAFVNAEECIGCGICELLCPFKAIEVVSIDQGDRAHVISASCKGCGVCSSHCPRRAIGMHSFGDDQILTQITAMATGKVEQYA